MISLKQNAPLRYYVLRMNFKQTSQINVTIKNSNDEKALGITFDKNLTSLLNLLALLKRRT